MLEWGSWLMWFKESQKVHVFQFWDENLDKTFEWRVKDAIFFQLGQSTFASMFFLSKHIESNIGWNKNQWNTLSSVD